MPERDASNERELGAALETEVRDQEGAARKLADFRGRNLVVYFYPADDTPGCTVEGKEFRELHDQFKAFDTVVVGVSTDSVERHKRFADKHAFPFVLLADTEGALAGRFGVLRNGRAARSTFVFDGELKLRREFHNVTPRGHAAQVLDFVRNLVESHRMLGG
jgi:peroxiredoxin Q/BCP